MAQKRSNEEMTEIDGEYFPLNDFCKGCLHKDECGQPDYFKMISCNFKELELEEEENWEHE